MKIEDLYSDLEDGVLLLTLLELISGKELGKWPKKPRVRFQKLENLNRAINFIKSEGLTLVNTGAEGHSMIVWRLRALKCHQILKKEIPRLSLE